MESEEIWLTNFYIAHPCKSLIGGYIILLTVAAIAIHFDCFLIPVASGREYLIYNDPIMTEYEQIEEVSKFSLTDLDGKGTTVKKTDEEDTGALQQIRKNKGESMYILYSNTDDTKPYGLLTKSFMESI